MSPAYSNKIPAESCRPRIIKGLERQHHPNPPVENQDLFLQIGNGDGPSDPSGHQSRARVHAQILPREAIRGL